MVAQSHPLKQAVEIVQPKCPDDDTCELALAIHQSLA